MIKNSINGIIKNKVEDNIIKNKLIQNHDKIVVAVSGGPDSMCLLDCLIQLQEKMKIHYDISYDIIVAHVNHMIRHESMEEKVYVEEFCNKKHLPFFYLQENVSANAKKCKVSEETYGRKIRYAFFEKVRNENYANLIATAHHQDDDVETILLNMLRGSGLKGLTGMGFRYKNIIRPLINIEKKDILEYNVEQDLNPCMDMTNLETVYLRNKVRNILIPTLKEEYNPNITNSIIRMKHILEVDEDCLNSYANTYVKEMIIENTDQKITFDFSILCNVHQSIRLRIIRKLIEIKQITLESIENVHVMDILTLLENNIKGKKYIKGNLFTIEIIKKHIAVIY